MNFEQYSYVAFLLAIIGYIPYIINTIKGTTRPHIYSWLVSSIMSMIIFGIQLSEQVGISMFVTLFITLICLVILVLGLKNGNRDIKKVDSIFLILSLVTLIYWLFEQDNLVAAILTAIIPNLAFIPTIRKTWEHPYSETLFTYLTSIFRNSFLLLSFTHYSLPAIISPVVTIVVLAVFSLLVIGRRIYINS